MGGSAVLRALFGVLDLSAFLSGCFGTSWSPGQAFPSGQFVVLSRRFVSHVQISVVKFHLSQKALGECPSLSIPGGINARPGRQGDFLTRGYLSSRNRKSSFVVCPIDCFAAFKLRSGALILTALFLL